VDIYLIDGTYELFRHYHALPKARDKDGYEVAAVQTEEGGTISAMDCPNCQLVNPPTATRCDCGYDFQTHTMQKSYLTDRDKKLSQAGAGFAGALLITFFVLKLTGVAVAKHSFALGIFTVVVAVVFIRLWFSNRKAASR
jgi:hypothetical protein